MACRSELGRGKHPTVRGEYITGNGKVMDGKNLDARDILKLAEGLRNTSGRKMKRFNNPVITSRPSIQGVFTPKKSLSVSIVPPRS